jgi:subtilisin family serine protease
MPATTGALVVTIATTAADDIRAFHTELHRVAAATPSVVLDTIGVAVIDADPDQSDALVAHAQSLNRSAILAVEPELMMHALATTVAPPFTDTRAATWGVHAVGALGATAAGAGARVAVLDTGIDTANIELMARVTDSRSFVPSASAHDGHGHGTHCAGIVCGPARPAHGPRFGVAPAAELLVGKVLDDDGSGPERQILAGLDWAVASGVHVVSMSLGSDVA